MTSKIFAAARRLHPMLLALAVATTASATAAAASMPAVTIKVVDVRSGTALQGVTAMLWQSAHGPGGFSGHGGKRIALFASETISDQSGALHFPRQQFDGPPLFSMMNEEAPAMLLLKPGYAPLVLDERYQLERPGATVAMTPTAPGPRSDMDLSLYLSTRDLLEPTDRCVWQHVPNTLVTGYHMSKGGSALSTLQADADRHTAAGCASPRTFFKHYGVDFASPFGEPVRPTPPAKAAPSPGMDSAAKAAAPSPSDVR
jgi:hypothetical protein